MNFRARILGAAAGGGLPQWNCGCANCNAARRGEIPAQSQSSLAVSANGTDWAILNASPDIRTQMADAPVLHPTGLRNLPLKSVLITNGDIDHIAGLLTLREMQAFDLYSTSEILDFIGQNTVFDALREDVVARRAIRLGETFELVPGLECSLFSVPGKVPLYLEGEEVQTDLEGEQTVGVEMQAGGQKVYYIPGCAAFPSSLEERVRGADAVFFDGTLWADDEMVRAGLSQKTGKRMGHMSISGADGTMVAFAGLDVGRKVFVHMNNTNPVLRPGAPERREAEAAGWVIGQDGMEMSL
ncbi:pyrroloquinoline quinone biosynthesis protein PqqB [Algicella marina]|uniref:Coenzyme PQQ synthesis protein B n=1 Tax=Algicella marina TaxID=2683284 RepID=A0A6P1SYN6_9RHOB|nr:pyrroloquinoline quinone biosynthesis protein PqqB [Algicella marina]QHQ34326.1 pyrroloquinoline quinone biosynthesis protein PqqB [Algicella marina]